MTLALVSRSLNRGVRRSTTSHQRRRDSNRRRGGWPEARPPYEQCSSNIATDPYFRSVGRHQGRTSILKATRGESNHRWCNQGLDIQSRIPASHPTNDGMSDSRICRHRFSASSSPNWIAKQDHSPGSRPRRLRGIEYGAVSHDGDPVTARATPPAWGVRSGVVRCEGARTTGTEAPAFSRVQRTWRTTCRRMPPVTEQCNGKHHG